MNRIIIGGILLLVLVGGYFFFTGGTRVSINQDGGTDESEESEEIFVNTKPKPSPFVVTESAAAKEIVSQGSYYVFPEQSSVRWAGKKSLIEGYVNSGSLAVKSGKIEVGEDSATGEFTLDMNSLLVADTPTKPGREGALEGHLKGSGWFDVETYPEASFVITSVSKRGDSDETYTYDVTGELTMKGETGELTFPALIYTDDIGLLRAEAQLEFDRTKWGITANSGNFFDNLADNVIDDMVALSFSLVAEGR